MSQEADALAVQAEKSCFIFLAKSNAFRQKIHKSETNEQSHTQFEGEANVHGINKI